MSDITALSHEYAASARLAEQINASVLALKKARLHQREAPQQDRKSLAEILGDIRHQLTNSPHGSDCHPAPFELLQRLWEENRTRLPYLLQDLEQVTIVLISKEPINQGMMAFLDQLCAAADAAATVNFRRLRRR